MEKEQKVRFTLARSEMCLKNCTSYDDAMETSEEKTGTIAEFGTAYEWNIGTSLFEKGSIIFVRENSTGNRHGVHPYCITLWM